MGVRKTGERMRGNEDKRKRGTRMIAEKEEGEEHGGREEAGFAKQKQSRRRSRCGKRGNTNPRRLMGTEIRCVAAAIAAPLR